MGQKTYVYIAGALNSDAAGYIQNMHRMVDSDLTLRRCGFITFNPCLDFLVGLQSGEMNYEDYTPTGLAWLEKSDCVYLVPGWESSKGTAAEIKHAEELGIPVMKNFADLLRFDGDMKRKYEEECKRIDAALEKEFNDEMHSMIEYEFARGLLEELWKAFSLVIKEGVEFDNRLFNDNEYYKELREKLFDFGVRGIEGFEYNNK